MATYTTFLLALAALVAGSQAAVPACTAGSAAPIHCWMGFTFTNVPNLASSTGTCFCWNNSNGKSLGRFTLSSSTGCNQNACLLNGFTTTAGLASTSAYFANNSAILANCVADNALANDWWQCNNLTSVLFPAGTNCLVWGYVCKGQKVPWSNGDGTSTLDYDCPPSFAGATYTSYEVVGTRFNPTNGLAACTAQLANYSDTHSFGPGTTCNSDNCNTAAILPRTSSGFFIKPAASLVVAAFIAAVII